MPCTKELQIDKSLPVLVTGGTGYVAGVLISQLLDKGLTVHTTVRDPSKKDRIQYLQDVADKSSGSIKFFKADLLTPGAFEEAMQGCYAVFHTASPFTSEIKDPTKDLVEPAVHGTENVLLQCNKTPSVRRVVVTSSCVAIYTDAKETKEESPTNEETWNRTATLTHGPYALSKTLAEQKAWTIAGGQNHWTLCTINPSLVVGPGLKYHESSESFKLIKSLGSNDPNMAMGVPDFGLSCVDIRDVAAAHIAAAYLESAAGRHILSGPGYFISELAEAMGKKYADEYPIATKRLPGAMKYIMWVVAPFMGQGLDRKSVMDNVGYKCHFDNTKSKESLGIEYIPMETSVQEMYQQMIDEKVVEPITK
ncbi:Anthocyanidin reductase ((2S)-flavan-3-ol-forming) [Seminavis robusta]|uniref:Anthocyanidin reductase ((2S)-flavan-3-ol-forming) n=1 Tax=Seminavis robusta TaxID=568900 RepID=A0A9N8F2A8_9STRA|nr:Anthocyanidin reductase ((2S)-flavan-3-ol-forming) [Seminavis robusta]|eukprot:Sro3448_g348140.1 Anthocyanidin reductase ((2S)-flavan-3-ol-forming) (365) ;mRNA; f:3299-4393